jgi:hypothetical protein
MTLEREALRDPSWWHWAATVPLLALHLAGVPWALPMAAGLCAAMAAGFLAVVRSPRPLPVQIRVAYLGLLLVGMLPWMGWVHWVQVAGTSAMVAIGYCPLARVLMLMAWNRSRPFTLAAVRHAFLESPTGGGLFRAILLERPGEESAAPSCSLRF